jgi:hypothetical protein
MKLAAATSHHSEFSSLLARVVACDGLVVIPRIWTFLMNMHACSQRARRSPEAGEFSFQKIVLSQ